MPSQFDYGGSLDEDLVLLVQAPTGTTIDIPVEQYRRPSFLSEKDEYRSAQDDPSRDLEEQHYYRMFIKAPVVPSGTEEGGQPQNGSQKTD